MFRLALMIVAPSVLFAFSQQEERESPSERHGRERARDLTLLRFTVYAGKQDRRDVPIRAPVPLDFRDASFQLVSFSDAEGKPIPAQLTAQHLTSDYQKPKDAARVRELCFVVPSLKAGRSASFSAMLQDKPAKAAQTFVWNKRHDGQTELQLAGKRILAYMHPRLDESTKETRELTFKPFHHLFDPDGQRLVTKGPGGLYTHHRGLFFGFNKVSYAGKEADVWHCRGEAFQSHEGVQAEDAGPVLGRHRVAIDWHGPKKEVFARETREVTVYNVPGGTLLDFASRVECKVGKVKLDGDPQHAGFHFRADNEVAEMTKGQTYFLRPDGPGKPGQTRNWPAQKSHVNLPWNAMSFVLCLGDRDQRYTALYLDHPANPKEARYSERDYGRFGSYFEYELDEKKPLEVRYRLWLQKGEMTVAEAARLSADFIDPPTVKVE